MRLILLLFALLVVRVADAQYYESPWQVGVKVGLNNYLGDLVVPHWNPIKGLDYGVALQGKYKLSDQWTVALGAGYLRLKGDESTYPERAARSYTFESSILEATLVAEYEFIRYGKLMDILRSYKKRYSPFVYAGAGMAFTNPKPDFSQNTIGRFQPAIDKFADRDLRQQLPVFPFGIGVKYGDYRSGTFAVQVQWGLTVTLTDLLDGVSEQANPDKNDWYQQLGVSLMYKF